MSARGARPIQHDYDEAMQVCYGCGALNEHGLQLQSFWDGERASAEFAADEKFRGVPGFAYGGLIASLIDCHAMAAASARFRDKESESVTAPRMVTVSLQVEYRKPTPLGDAPLVLMAEIIEESERKAVVSVELSVAGEVTATGQVVAVRIPDSMQF